VTKGKDICTKALIEQEHITKKIRSSRHNQVWILVVAARPNLVKIAPLIREINTYNRTSGSRINPFLVHTGQHYDNSLSGSFFKDLDLPKPDIDLGIGSGSHGEQTGRTLIEFEKVLFREQPDLVIVVGDVNSTLACALAAVKLHIPVAHVEAGLRSYDRNMPEEINRVLTDAVSDYLFTPSSDGNKNLSMEGIPEEKIYLVGDIMIDSLSYNLSRAKETDILKRLKLVDGNQKVLPYGLLTLHRPSNVDDKDSFKKIIHGLQEVASRIPILFPVHPRTIKQIRAFRMEKAFSFHETTDLQPKVYIRKNILVNKIHCFEPFSYLDFINMMAHAKVVFTDSGGVQEETTVLNIPCITLRETTERPITVTEGTNVIVHNDSAKIIKEARCVLDGKKKPGHCPKIWDGHTAERIVKILAERKVCGFVK
jgi:UDP-N-acetylglucosamine 2-epimerase (non-hydrolysing)